MSKTFVKQIVVFILSVLFCVNLAFAQDLGASLESMLKDNAVGYVQPLVTGFGTAMNSGLYKKASVKTGLLPIGFDFGIVTGIGIVPDDKMDFEYSLLENVIPFPLSDIDGNLPDIELNFGDLYDASSETTPNIASDEDGTELTPKSNSEIVDAIIIKLGEEGISNPELFRSTLESNLDIDGLVTAFKFPSGLNARAIPAPTIQANVRVPFGIEVSVRALPEIDLDDFGSIKMFGAGLRKSLPVPIINVTAGAFYQKLEIGDLCTATNLNFHVEAGKTVGLLFLKVSPYVGAGLDKSSIEVNYDIPAGSIPGINEVQKVSFDLDGENKMRVNAGLTLQLIPFTYLNIEASKGEYMSAAISLGLILN